MLARRFARPSSAMGLSSLCGSSRGSLVSTTRFYATQSNNIVEIADQTHFETAVMEASDSKPVIVDCYADWCRPCRQLAPKLEGVVESRKGAVQLAKVNVDTNGEVAQQLMVTSIPAVYAFYKREAVNRFVGDKSIEELNAWVDNIVKRTTQK